MIKILASISFTGEKFSPNLVEKELGIIFSKKNEKGELAENGKYRNRIGSASIDAPTHIAHFDRILWLCNYIDRKTILLFKKEGAKSIHFSIGYFYLKQCNCELSKEELIAISKLNIGFAFSCYKCTKKEFDGIK